MEVKIRHNNIVVKEILCRVYEFFRLGTTPGGGGPAGVVYMSIGVVDAMIQRFVAANKLAVNKLRDQAIQ